jgi:hypothetical protein
MKIDEKKVNNYIKFLVISIDLMILAEEEEEADKAMQKLTESFTTLRVHPLIANEAIDKIRTEMQDEINKIGFEAYSIKMIPFFAEIALEQQEFEKFCEFKIKNEEQ